MWNQEQANKRKTYHQSQAVEIQKEHKALFLEWATGVGKSKAAIDIIDGTPGQWYIICKETTHINNWVEEFKKFQKTELLERVELFCYDSLHKYTNTKANLVLDEAHGITPKRLYNLKTINFSAAVALTATMPKEKRWLLDGLDKFHYYTVSVNKAIAEGILPSPTVYKVYVEFDTQEEKLEYDELCRKIDKQLAQMKYMNVDWLRNKMLNNASKRKRLIGNAKTRAIKELLDETAQDKRYICFTTSIQQCEEVGGEDATVIHSKIGKNAVKKVIEDFNNYENDTIYAVNMVRESVNLRDIDQGYIVQLDKQTKSFVQMLGRCFRSQEPIMYVLVMKDTQDEKFMDAAFKAINMKYVKTYPKVFGPQTIGQ